MQIALYKPLIPPNTGNIGRLCLGFGVSLSLIGPLGFSLTQKELRRAGLDYWPKLSWQRFASFAAFHSQIQEKSPQTRILCLSKKTSHLTIDFKFHADDVLLFGNEAKGFPFSLSKKYGLQRIALPMSKQIRSYNLANAAAMTLYAAYACLGWQL